MYGCWQLQWRWKTTAHLMFVILVLLQRCKCDGNVAPGLERECCWEVWIYSVLCSTLLYCSPESCCVCALVCHWMCVASPTVYAHERRARLCVCIRFVLSLCDCLRLHVRSPLGRPPTSFNISLFDVRIWHLLSVSPHFQPNDQIPPEPCKRLQNPSLKKWMKSFLFFPPHSLLKIITPRIGKFCQNKDDMKFKPSWGKKHFSDVIFSLYMCHWYLCIARS